MAPGRRPSKAPAISAARKHAVPVAVSQLKSNLAFSGVGFATTGDADYHLRVVVRDIKAYNQFLDEFMFRVPGIRYVRTNMILKEIKTAVALPFESRVQRK